MTSVFTLNMEIKVSVLKVYKEKPYLNSNGDPFGLTINGKNKEYVHAHELIKGFLKKGKEFLKGFWENQNFGCIAQ